MAGQLGIELGGCGGGGSVRALVVQPAQGSCHNEPVMNRARRISTRGNATSDRALPVPYADIDKKA